MGNFFHLLLHLDEYLEKVAAFHPIAAYVLLYVIVFWESGLVVSFLPGDALLFTAGVFSASGAISMPLARGYFHR